MIYETGLPYLFTKFTALKQQKTLSSRLTSHYLMIIRDEETFAQKKTIPFTLAKLIVIFVAISLVIMTISFFLITTLLAKWVDPQYQAIQTKIQISELEREIDSLNYLTEVNEKKEKRVRMILSGQIEMKDWSSDTAKSNQVAIDSLDIDTEHPIDSAFRKEYENTDYDVLTQRNKAKESLQQLYFWTPVKGIITQDFNVKNRHFGTDVVAKKDETIKCVADGTVIMSSWTQGEGHVIAVQHKQDLISFYKHNSALLKKAGDVVKAGQVIAIIGNSGEFTEGPHLHFELWYKGNPVNPEDFIRF